MSIIYKNQYGNIINEIQANNIKIFSREMFINNDKIVEYVNNNQVAETHYYLLSNSDFSDLLNQFINKKVCFHKRQINNDFFVFENFLYDNNNLIEKSKSILDSSERNICFQKININTNQPIIGSTEKYYYDENDIQKYLFDYNDNGACFMINDLENGDEILASSVGQPHIDFSWSGFEYYQNAEPIIPA